MLTLVYVLLDVFLGLPECELQTVDGSTALRLFPIDHQISFFVELFHSRRDIQRFARYWEIVANSGRFALGLKLLLESGSAFHHFLNFSDWLWSTTGKTHEFAPEKLVDLLHEHLTAVRGLADAAVRSASLADYLASGARGRPHCLAGLLRSEARGLPAGSATPRVERQNRHLQQQAHRDEIQKAAAVA